MALGAVYDLAFALAMLTAQQTAARILGIEPPRDPFYLRFAGLLLLLLGAAYLLAAADPVGKQGLVALAACGRLAGFCFFWVARWSGRERAFLVLGLVDLGFAVLHAWLLLRARRSGAS